MIRAGIWARPSHLIVALQPPGPRPSRMHLRVERTLDGRGQLTDYLAREPYLEVVLPELLHRFDAIVTHLHFYPIHVWLAPAPLVDEVLTLIAARPTATVTIAATLARLPAFPRLRAALQPLPPPDPKHLCLALPHLS